MKLKNEIDEKSTRLFLFPYKIYIAVERRMLAITRFSTLIYLLNPARNGCSRYYISTMQELE